MDFSLILVIEFTMKKKLWNFWELKNQNMTETFNLLIVYLINTLLFVRIKQISKSRSPEAVIQMFSLK